MKLSDHYLKLVEWSQEDQCYVGSCPGLFMGGVDGADEVDVYKQLCQVVDETIRIILDDGEALPPATADKQYSGKFVIRVGESLHKSLSINALKAGESLNTYCVKRLREVPTPYELTRQGE